MEMFHVVLARWFQVDQHRHFAAELVECCEIDAVPGTVGDRGEMDEAVGRAADCLQHDLRISERRLGQQFAGPWSLRQPHDGGDLAAGFGGAKADRKSVVWGKSVDLGGRRIIKKKKKKDLKACLFKWSFCSLGALWTGHYLRDATNSVTAWRSTARR